MPPPGISAPQIVLNPKAKRASEGPKGILSGVETVESQENYLSGVPYLSPPPKKNNKITPTALQLKD